MTPLRILLALCLTTLAPLAAAADDAQAVRDLIGATFDTPHAKVASDPIIVEQDYAIADWVQGEKGGRALLRRKDGKWNITLCAGDWLKQADNMGKAGVPADAAAKLAQRLNEAESRLTPEQRAQFSRFKPEQPAANHAGHTDRHGSHH